MWNSFHIVLNYQNWGITIFKKIKKLLFQLKIARFIWVFLIWLKQLNLIKNCVNSHLSQLEVYRNLRGRYCDICIWNKKNNVFQCLIEIKQHNLRIKTHRCITLLKFIFNILKTNITILIFFVENDIITCISKINFLASLSKVQQVKKYFTC